MGNWGMDKCEGVGKGLGGSGGAALQEHLPTRTTFALVPGHAPFTKSFSPSLRSRLFLRTLFSIGPDPLATPPSPPGPRLVLCRGGGGHRRG